MTLTLPPRDPRIHVFSVSDGGLTLAHQTFLSRLSETPEDAVSLADAFAAPIDNTYAEVFAIGDVSPMSLRDYLAQAHDIPVDLLAVDAARLDALSGDVVVLAPRALEGGGTLHPRGELTHIGSYATAEADNAPRDLPPAVRDPALAAPDVPSDPPVRASRVPWIIAGALVLAALLVALL
ncbi:MAG: hypothetical protein WBA67_02830 [Jannaschia sp.]